MKAKFFFAMLLSFSTLFITSHAFALGISSNCGRCGECGGHPGFCDEQESPCACVDQGWKWNTCMTKAEYCDAFGDLGALDD